MRVDVRATGTQYLFEGHGQAGQEGLVRHVAHALREGGLGRRVPLRAARPSPSASPGARAQRVLVRVLGGALGAHVLHHAAAARKARGRGEGGGVR